jgi:hypothetical protein
VTSDGSAHTRLKLALRSKNLSLVRNALAEIPVVDLRDAIGVCAVIGEARPDLYDAAAVRWIGRLCAERKGVTLDDVRRALDALERLDDPAGPAGQELVALLRQRVGAK